MSYFLDSLNIPRIIQQIFLSSSTRLVGGHVTLPQNGS